jgi:hypothetical protein
MPYIHYSGIGCNNNEIHTVEEFLNTVECHPLGVASNAGSIVSKV